jgi:predicted Zn-dependent protease
MKNLALIHTVICKTLLLILALPGYAIPSEVLFTAMQKELSRSINKLQMEHQEKPYFISYNITEDTVLTISATLGNINSSECYTTRQAYVEVRVGSYEKDNTLADKENGVSGTIPITDDEVSIRHALWLLTDKAYKMALENFLCKKAKDAYEMEPEENNSIPDFSKDAVNISTCTSVKKVVIEDSDKANWERKTKNLSLIFKKHPEILSSFVSFAKVAKSRYFVSSEGDMIYSTYTACYIHSYATTKSKDGFLLSNFRFFEGENEDDLPEDEKVCTEIENMVNELLSLRNATKIDRCVCPVIFQGAAACVFFKNLLTEHLLGEREKSEQGELLLESKINTQIMPKFITVVDDPTLKCFMGKRLYGSYEYDEEGVKAEKVVLVENGILKNFLTTRTPIKSKSAPTYKSNGHARSISPKPYVSNLIVIATKTYSLEELKKKMLEFCHQKKKNFGLIVCSMFRTGNPILVYKVDAKTGKETLVRSIESFGRTLSPLEKLIGAEETFGNTLSLLEKIVACGNDYNIRSYDLTTTPVSFVAPSVLISEIEVNPVAEKPKKAPILPAPWTE